MTLRQEWEAQAADWITWARAPGFDGFWWGTWPALRDLLPEPPSRPCTVVEIGCGEGRAGRELLARGHRVLGIEQSPSLASAARSGQPPLPVVRGDAAALPVATGAVSLVVACMSLQDIDDLGSAIGEIGRILRSGGCLCASIVHPFGSALGRSSIGTGPEVVEQPYLQERRYVDVVRRDGLQMTFVSMHHPLQAYVAHLADAGLAITALREFGEAPIPWLLTFRADKAPRPFCP